jgi:hypothetical protein
MQPARSIIQDQLENRTSPAQAAQAGGGNLAANQGGLVELERGDGLKMPAVFVTARAVQEEIANRAKLQAMQLSGALVADAGQLFQRSQQRIMRGCHKSFIPILSFHLKL